MSRLIFKLIIVHGSMFGVEAHGVIFIIVLFVTCNIVLPIDETSLYFFLFKESFDSSGEEDDRPVREGAQSPRICTQSPRTCALPQIHVFFSNNPRFVLVISSMLPILTPQ